MIFKQKSRGIKTTFDFQAERLEYQKKEGMLAQIFSVPYESIDFLDPVRTETVQSWVATLVMLAFALGGAAGAGFNETGIHRLVLVSTITVGALFLVVYHFRCSRYGQTAFGTPKGDICVLHGKNYDAVMGELEKRFRERVLALYGDVNFNNSYEDEITKFKNLKNQGLITTEEYQSAFNKIKERVRERNLEVNADIPPHLEIRKFEWMLDYAFISLDEFQQSVEQVKHISLMDDMDIHPVTDQKLH